MFARKSRREVELLAGKVWDERTLREEEERLVERNIQMVEHIYPALAEAATERGQDRCQEEDKKRKTKLKPLTLGIMVMVRNTGKSAKD